MDGRYEKYDDGVIYDTQTGLEWLVGPDTGTPWQKAREWVDGLAASGGGWRMPTRSEVFALYRRGVGQRNMSGLFETTGWLVWSGAAKGESSVVGFYEDSLDAATSITNAKPSIYSRAFAVRSRSDKM